MDNTYKNSNEKVTTLPILLMCLGLSLSAQAIECPVGSRPEAIAAALSGEEPAYIQKRMAIYAQTFARFVSTKKIESPREKLALFFTITVLAANHWGAPRDVAVQLADTDAIRMHADRIAYDSAWTRACSPFDGAPSYVYHYSAWCAAWVAAHRASDGLCDAALKRAKKTARRAANAATRKGFSPNQVIAIAYRVAEWSVFNNPHFLNSASLESVYQAALESLPEDDNLALNPFATEQTWHNFQDEWFGELSADAKVFLAPWIDMLNHIMSPWRPERHIYYESADRQIVQTLLLANNRLWGQAGVKLPKDVMYYQIIPLVMMAYAEARLEGANAMAASNRHSKHRKIAAVFGVGAGLFALYRFFS